MLFSSMEPFRYLEGRPVTWYSRSLEQSNHHCLYCATDVGPRSTVPSNKEHVIARRSVPTGSLDGPGFNFIFRACTSCNSEKADAERHVASVTLFNSPARLEDPLVDAEARRKAANDFHPRHRGKVVAQSATDHTITGSFGGASMRFSLMAPPQTDPRTIALLATRQIQALFALVTVPDPRGSNIRLLHPEQCQVYGHYHFGDWGNPQLLAIIQRAAPWPSRATIVAANGYFKAKLRRSDIDSEGWFWALEWNRYLRVVGTIAFPEAPSPLLSGLPPLDWQPLYDGRGRMRVDVPLGAAEDTLFTLD